MPSSSGIWWDLTVNKRACDYICMCVCMFVSLTQLYSTINIAKPTQLKTMRYMWPIPSSLPIIRTWISNHLHKTMWCNCSWARMNDYIPQKTVEYSTHTVYTPVWKTDVLCRGDVVRLSVRPSEFSGLFSTCFDISIWNLVYAFSRWHDMWSLSFITTGSLWPSLQPKVGQTQFLQSWPYKSR